MSFGRGFLLFLALLLMLLTKFLDLLLFSFQTIFASELFFTFAFFLILFCVVKIMTSLFGL